MRDQHGIPTQAALERAIRAAKAEGLPVVRIIAHRDGYIIETDTGSSKNESFVRKSKPVL